MSDEYSVSGVFHATRRADGKVVIYLYGIGALQDNGKLGRAQIYEWKDLVVGRKEEDIKLMTAIHDRAREAYPLMGLLTVDEKDMDSNFTALKEEKR